MPLSPISLRLACRNSKLSLIQANAAKKRIEQQFPQVTVQIKAKASKGDLDQQTPLYLMQDKHVFTKDMDEMLLSGEADLAVHSAKDLGGEAFEDARFCHAVFERDIPHDVMVWAPGAAQRMLTRKQCIIGTSSLRRAALVPSFVRWHDVFLAQHPDIPLTVHPIRGNVDTRIAKLMKGEYDAIVLAAAGLNRLCAHEPGIKTLLDTCTLSLLPLMECPPAPGQGALVMACLRSNPSVADIVRALQDPDSSLETQTEREYAKTVGTGCHQQFGVLSLHTKAGIMTRMAGLSSDGQVLDQLTTAVELDSFDIRGKTLFSATDFMGDFFTYENSPLESADWEQLAASKWIYVAHHRAILQEEITPYIKDKAIWVSGTRSWRELTKMGMEVRGCADGFGLHFLDPVFNAPLFDLPVREMLIVTHQAAVQHWRAEGYNAIGTYRLIPNLSEAMIDRIRHAELFFWTNFEQFELARPYLSPQSRHACPAGKTADRFQNAGLKPVIFPGIKAFNHWRIQHLTV